jgi:hypothetical protein
MVHKSMKTKKEKKIYTHIYRADRLPAPSLVEVACLNKISCFTMYFSALLEVFCVVIGWDSARLACAIG